MESGKKMTDQRDLVEKEEWDHLILLDACRYDYFEKIYPEYMEGNLLKVWNGGVSYTLDWYVRTFRRKYEVALYDPTLFTPEQQKDVGWKYSNHFSKVVCEEIEFDFDKGTSTPERVKEMVRKHDWNGKSINRIMQPHPPFINTPLEELTKGRGKIQRTQRMVDEGRLTFGELRDAYEKNVRIAFEGAVDLIPDLDGDVVITSDHGECLGRCGQFYHARGYEEHDHLVEVPWFNVEDTVEQ